MNIKDLIKDNRVSFLEYRKGLLWYQLDTFRPIQGSSFNERVSYKFSVPIEDCGDATFPASEKAIMFMRYIRQAMNDGTLVKI